MCKIINLAGGKAIWENIFFDYECSPSFWSQIYFNNKNQSIYKGLVFQLSLEDAEGKILKLYDCTNVEAATKAYSESLAQSENIMERKNLSDKDLKRLKIIDQILSTFKFIK